jgi:hypothetical protein
VRRTQREVRGQSAERGAGWVERTQSEAEIEGQRERERERESTQGETGVTPDPKT